MDNNLVLPPDISPAAREYFERYRAAFEKFKARVSMKPFGWDYVAAQEQMRDEVMRLAAEYPPGTVGTVSGGGGEPLTVHEYKGYIIAIYTFPKVNGQYSTLSGIRRVGTPIPEEPFPMSEQVFPTQEAAAGAALEESKKQIDAAR